MQISLSRLEKRGRGELLSDANRGPCGFRQAVLFSWGLPFLNSWGQNLLNARQMITRWVTPMSKPGTE